MNSILEALKTPDEAKKVKKARMNEHELVFLVIKLLPL